MAQPVKEAQGPLARLHDEIDRMFQDLAPRLWTWPDRQGRLPAIDMFEKDGNLIIEAELPGVNKDDVKVSYTNHSLAIEAELRQEKEEKREGYFRAERHFGRFYRLLPLPEEVDFEKSTAEFKDGLLRISLPKSPQPAEGMRTIPILDK